MSSLKLKVKKAKMVRRIDGEKKTGFYGRVITSGKASFEDIARESAKNTTLHMREAVMAAGVLLDGVCEKLKQGYIVDLGPLGTLYPAVTGKWEEDPDSLSLSDMTPKVNYKGSDDIVAAIRGASLSWATAKDEEEGTEVPEEDNPSPNSPDGEGAGTGNAGIGDDEGQN